MSPTPGTPPDGEEERLPLTPAGWGGLSQGHEEIVPPSPWRRFALVGGLVFLGTLGCLAALQFSPGVSASLRPLTRWRLWQAERFFAEGMAAERAGDWAQARVAYGAALDLRPEAAGPRRRLARHLAETGELQEALRVIAPVTPDPELFVHDALLHVGDFTRLAGLACDRLDQPRVTRRGVWLSALRLALARGSAGAVGPQGARNGESEDWVAAIRAASRRDVAALAAALGRREADGLDAAATMVGFELWIQAQAVSEAWVWLQRHRSRLGDFDRALADWSLQLARGENAPVARVPAFFAGRLDASRWRRLAAAALVANRADAIGDLARYAEAVGPPWPSGVCVGFWALALAMGDEAQAAVWETRERQAGGRSLPVILGRALADADGEKRWRAALLLAAEAGLPRELVLVFATGGALTRPAG